MKFAYLILCHKNANQVRRLIQRLNGAEVHFIVHASKSGDKGFFRNLKHELHEFKNVYFCKREDGTPCAFGIVQGILNGLSLTLEKNIDFDYIVLLSGQDYPIKKEEERIRYFQKFNGKDIVPYFSIDPADFENEKKNKNFEIWSNPQLYRIQQYWIHYCPNGKVYSIPDDSYRYGLKDALSTYFQTIFSSKSRGLLVETGNFFLTAIAKKRVLYPDNVVIFGGYTWWGLTRNTVKFLVQNKEKHKKLNDFFRHTLIPDEMYFQTLLLNSNQKDKIVSEFIKESVWDFKISATHPLIFKKEDIDRLKTSEKPFARKFDDQIDANILNLIDKELLSIQE